VRAPGRGRAGGDRRAARALGETPAAVAVLAPGASLTLGELREWGNARLARYKLPTILHVVDALPRNASGKVMKTALRREYR